MGLTNSRVAFNPTVASVACMPSVRLKPGVNRFPVKVLTTYVECGVTPKCTKSGAPLLPKGSFHTKTVILGLPSGTKVANRISVTIS